MKTKMKKKRKYLEQEWIGTEICNRELELELELRQN